MMLRLTGTDITCCPKCKRGKMKVIKKLEGSLLQFIVMVLAVV